MAAMKIVTVQEMREVEAASVRLGVSLDLLQQNAAAAVAREIERLFPGGFGPALFLVGPGNNGRDALIAADLLREGGWAIRAYLAPKVGSEDVLQRLREGGAEIQTHGDPADDRLFRRWVSEADLMVDGLLGIGIRGPVREPIAGIISMANEEATLHRVPMVAVDLPSGIDADSGEVGALAVRANHTISLGCVKAGLLRFPAAEYVGALVPVGIGLPPATYASIRWELLTPGEVAELLPRRPLNGHKGSFGRVLVVAGSRSFLGAPYLAGAGAARAGCGLVTLAVPEWQRTALAARLPEATYLPLLDSEEVAPAEANAQTIGELLADCNALALGPGLGRSPGVSRLVMAVLEANRSRARVPTVVDADGLNALAEEAEWWDRIGPGHLLTPHPGEMSRLVGLPTEAIQGDRWGVALEAAGRWGQIVVLKGAFTVVAGPEGSGWVSPFANPALASAGTGDVLTGLIAGLMAQGAAPVEAARAGVFLHGAAAEKLLASSGTDRLLASDLLPVIPKAIGDLR